jgi:hypothetical protein
MSGIMKITFAKDMPMATVEVLTPDLETVRQVALEPGREVNVPVPSEASFIRVHLPSGRSVTLRHPGNLDYVVTRADVESRLRKRRSDPTSTPPPQSIKQVRFYHDERAVSAKAGVMAPTQAAPPVDAFGVGVGTAVLPDGVYVKWTPDVGGGRSQDGREWLFAPPQRDRPYQLEIGDGGLNLKVVLPAKLRATYVRVDSLRSGHRVASVRVSMASDTVDTVGRCLARGDYYAGEAMAPLVDEAMELLVYKMQDPYAAALGAYLLLGLERFDLMHSWAKNLADRFPWLADGCVIWASQCLRQANPNADEASKYLLAAASRGLPIFTEGLRVLVDGLQRLGPPGHEALATVTKLAGPVLWTSPFTARLDGRSSSMETGTTFDVDYIASV